MPAIHHPCTPCLFRWLRPLRIVTLCVSLALLSACGGGSGGDDNPTTPPATTTYNVGGLLAGLGAGKNVTLAHVDAAGATVQSAALSANGAYALRLPAGTAYNLRVLVQPLAQTCTVANGTGTASADVNTISVTCQDTIAAPEAKPVTGRVTGLGAGKTLVLQLSANGSTQEAVVHADGSFQFPQGITGTYTVTVKTPPTGQACTVANGQGVVGQSVGAAISVSCANSAYTLGGSVSGNAGVVVLRNSANGDSTTVSGNGAFAFAQPVLHGAGYTVSVFDQSAGQSCSMVNGAGTALADVRDIAVNCTAIVVVPPPVPVPVPGVPANLAMAYGIKIFSLSWDTVTAPAGGGAVSYKLFEDPDGAGPLASSQIGGTLSAAAYAHTVSGLLHTRLNAQYRVQACNTSGCSALTAALTPNLTQAIGYFKASNTGANDLFGNAVALSADGSTLAVGAPGESSNATGIDGSQADNSFAGAGAVYVFTRNGTVWSQQAYVKPAVSTFANDQFGYAIALSSDGNTLAVGAYLEDGLSNVVNVGEGNVGSPNTDAGAVYVFTRSGTTWGQQAYLKSGNAGYSSYLGWSVTLSADGNTLAAGAINDPRGITGVNPVLPGSFTPGAGAAHVFTRVGTLWSHQAYVKASNTEANDNFGHSVALSGDGNTLAVSALNEDSNATGIGGDQASNSRMDAGAVYLFTRTGTVWSQQAYIKASNAWQGQAFGVSLVLSFDGSTLAVGANGEGSNAVGIGGAQNNTSANASGAVYVFARSAAVWTQQEYIKSSNSQAGDLFGTSVSLSSDGNTLAVGAVGESSNAAGIGGAQSDNSTLQSGAAYLFTRSGATWSQRAYLKASNTAATDMFGSSVALSADGSALAVGALAEDSSATGIGGDQANNGATSSGAVYVY
ncbi:MAG: beta strand repeat-containing protein [Acidovorax sp.]|uniref:beta strand repeat-containing protein n=1 Tax=Acidovorax sp. TaxID=1872122 RepID=UPI003919F973